jgi:ribulose-phosphate 3-epimerase
VKAFADAGADALTVHVEATSDPPSVIQQIRDQGCLAGLALNPATPLTDVLPHVHDCDLVLVMSVPAGFGGQAFNPVALEKLAALRSYRRDLLLEVDGGIDPKTIGPCRAAGADLFVVGSAIFRQADYRLAIEQLALELEKAV